jgi:hypothetical protein
MRALPNFNACFGDGVGQRYAAGCNGKHYAQSAAPFTMNC